MKSKATRRFLESALRRVPPRTIATPWFRSWLRTCETLRITSDEALVSKYRHFRGREKFLAIMVLYHHRYRGAIPLLFRELRSPDALIGGAAGGALAMIGGQSVLVGLQKMLSEAAVCGLRERVVGALALFNGPSLWRRTAPILSNIFDSRSESANVRATAAEGLANALGDADKRTAIFRSAVKSLIRALDDRSPDVRCCAAYALGQLEAKAALPALARLSKHDTGRCGGIGPVHTEAAEAIARILQGRYSVNVGECGRVEDQHTRHVDQINIRSI